MRALLLLLFGEYRVAVAVVVGGLGRHGLRLGGGVGRVHSSETARDFISGDFPR